LHGFSIEDIQELMTNALTWLETATYEDDVKEAIMQRLMCRQQINQLLHGNSLFHQADQSQTHSQIELLNALGNSVRCGIAVPGSFSLKIQRTLASSLPPRPMVKVEYKQALAYFENFFIDSSKVFEVFDADGSADLLAAYWLFMARKPQPSVYIRALLQSFLDRDEKVLGRYSDKMFIFDDLQRLVLPTTLLLNQSNDNVEVLSDKRFQITKELDKFVSKTKLSFTKLFRTACLNRCRIRRTLCHAVIEWDQLQAEAEDLDEIIRKTTNERPRSFPLGGQLTYSYPLSSWVYHHKLCQMETLVQMGFELSIYAPDEIPSMYWYLSHLCSIHLSHLDRIKFFIEKSDLTTSRSIPASYHAPSEQNSKTEASLRFLFRIFAQLKATESLASSLHLVYTILARRGHLSNVSRPYASDQLRYELRMRPFLHLSIPEPPDFEEFQIATSLQQLTDHEILVEAQRAATQAKTAWEDVLKQTWNCQVMKGQDPKSTNSETQHTPAACIEEQWGKDVKNVVKACIGTSISIAMLRRILEESNRKDFTNPIPGKLVELPEPGDKDYWHKYWRIPRISS
jgi:N-alpha-acetyltransferase 35, NatC auxiliary subunit